MLGWLSFFNRARRRRSPFNNLGPQGLTCGQVTEHLFVGGELGPEDWPALQKIGVTTVVNLQQEQQDVFTEEERIEGYLWLPAPDGLAPNLEQLALGVEFIKGAIETRRRVFVHCKAGQGRAPLLCACYLISQGMSHLDAITQVQRARPRTMLTPEQNVRLREFATALAHYATPVEGSGLPAPTLNGSADSHEAAVAVPPAATIAAALPEPAPVPPTQAATAETPATETTREVPALDGNGVEGPKVERTGPEPAIRHLPV